MIEALFRTISNLAMQMHWSEELAVLFNVLYIVLAMRQNRWCWPFGIIASVLSIYLFFLLKLYAEAILYFYYVLAGIYGWFAWKANDKMKALPLSTLSVFDHLKWIGAGVLLSITLALFLRYFTDANLPFIDAHTTIFSFIATYLTTRKVLENWIYWIVIDIVSAGMYLSRGLYLYALLMVVFTILAWIGWQKWRKENGEVAIAETAI